MEQFKERCRFMLRAEDGDSDDEDEQITKEYREG
jgi:hypothetical protein